MQIELGTRVHTLDGKDVGKIDKLILDPQGGEVKAVVVRKGFILPDDVTIPLDMLQQTAEGEAQVTCTAEGLDKLPRFSEADYTAAPPADVAPYGSPGSGVLWPVEAIYPAVPPAAVYPPGPSAGAVPAPQVSEEELERERQQDLANAVIDEGSDVICRGGEKAGEVHSVIVDTDSGRPVRLVVRKGFLFTQDFELPASAIAAVDDGVVYLNLDKEQLRRTVVTVV